MPLGTPDFVARSDSTQLASHGSQVPHVKLSVSLGAQQLMKDMSCFSKGEQWLAEGDIALH